MGFAPRRALALLLALAGLAAPAAAATKRMFVTSTAGSGDLSTWEETNLDGIAGANEICQTRAELAGLVSGGQEFVAWISDSTTDAWCNVQGLTGQKPACSGPAADGGPWVRTDGVLFADSLSQLTSAFSPPYVPPLRTEDGGTAISPTHHWSGSFGDGDGDGAPCSDWSATTGDARFGNELTTNAWGNNGSESCAQNNRLVCFELGVGDAVARPKGPARIVFTTLDSGNGDLGSWVAAGDEQGIAAGNAICAAEALAAKLPEPLSYRAWLSDGATDAWCQVQGLGGTREGDCGGATLLPPAAYRRPDGFLLASDLEDLADGALETSPNQVAATSSYSNGSAWTGTAADGRGTGADCDGWAEPTGIAEGTFGFSLYVDDSWTSYAGGDCNFERRLYCVSTVEVLFWDGFEDGAGARWDDSLGLP